MSSQWPAPADPGTPGEPAAVSPSAGRPGPARPGFQSDRPQPAGSQTGLGQPGYGTAQSVLRPPWKARPDGVTTFRHYGPLVLWWAWVIFLVFNTYGIAATHSSIIHSARLAALLLLVTGVMYACTVHSRVTCDDEGVTIYNPLRSHRALWGALDGVYVGDSVEFHCHRPTPKKDKTIHSWALSARRRSRVKMQAQRSFISQSRRVTNQEAAKAAASAQPDASELIAAELARRASAAQGKGAPAAFLHSTWAWRPVAAIAVPAVALLVTLLVS